ncbi:MAG: caspase family protein [Planctomycetaceae bacterium]|nr:caspase family protein [Planctomycetaceae bacterium]
MQIRYLLLVTSLLLGLSVSHAFAGRKLAVVVGVDTYRANSALPALKHAANDAASLSGALRRAGFTVMEMTHAAAREEGQELMAPNLAYVRDHIEGVLSTPNLGPDDTVLISLHGHGVQFVQNGDAETTTQRFYFCPADATISGVKKASDITERQHLLPLEELYSSLSACPAATKLLIVDACRNDPTQPGVFRSGLASSTLPKLPPPPGGMAAFFSCKANQRAVEDPDLEHGVFTHFLVEGLNGKADQPVLDGQGDGVVTLSELTTFVANNTYAYVFKKYQGLKQSPDIRGEFDANLPLVQIAQQLGLQLSSAEIATRLKQAQEELPQLERQLADYDFGDEDDHSVELAFTLVGWNYARLGNETKTLEYVKKVRNPLGAARMLGRLAKARPEFDASHHVESLVDETRERYGQEEYIDIPWMNPQPRYGPTRRDIEQDFLKADCFDPIESSEQQLQRAAFDLKSSNPESAVGRMVINPDLFLTDDSFQTLARMVETSDDVFMQTFLAGFANDMPQFWRNIGENPELLVELNSPYPYLAIPLAQRGDLASIDRLVQRAEADSIAKAVPHTFANSLRYLAADRLLTSGHQNEARLLVADIRTVFPTIALAFYSSPPMRVVPYVTCITDPGDGVVIVNQMSFADSPHWHLLGRLNAKDLLDEQLAKGRAQELDTTDGLLPRLIFLDGLLADIPYTANQ